MITFQEESFADFWKDAEQIANNHSEEIKVFKDIPLKINLDLYIKGDEMGSIKTYTARKEGLLIGYAVFAVVFNIHYSDSLQATQDAIYVAPEHRKGHTGLRLIRYTEKMLGVLGVEVIYHHAKVKHPQLGRLLEYCGYEPTDQLYARRL